MSFSEEWELKQYSQGRQINRYPFTSLVSLVMRYAHPKNYKVGPVVVELGCGTGPNISFFLENDFTYCGIEGSFSAVEITRKEFGDKVVIHHDDFTKRLPFADASVDLVVDRSATTHNAKREIVRVVNETYRILKDNGTMIAVDWFSDQDSESASGEAVDPKTKTNYALGRFKDVGTVHFFDKEEICGLFSDGWEIEYLSHQTSTEIIPAKDNTIASYNVVAVKKEKR